MYEYSARIVRLVDADTLRADVDLGFGVWMMDVSLRLLGLDAPERNTPAGAAATQALSSMLLGRTVTIQTERDKHEKYGRWLATVLAPQSDGSVLNVNLWMIAGGYARPYDGGKR